MPNVTKINNLETYITKDKSSICELMHPAEHHNANQSLAQATVPINTETQLHYHACTEELYHITQGSGVMKIEDNQFPVETGDTICIPPHNNHKIKNTDTVDLVFLCCCSPAYSHDDTFLISNE